MYVGIGAKDNSSIRNWEKEPCVSYPWNKLYTQDGGGPTRVTFKNAQRCFHVGESKECSARGPEHPSQHEDP